MARPGRADPLDPRSLSGGKEGTRDPVGRSLRSRLLVRFHPLDLVRRDPFRRTAALDGSGLRVPSRPHPFAVAGARRVCRRGRGGAALSVAVCRLSRRVDGRRARALVRLQGVPLESDRERPRSPPGVDPDGFGLGRVRRRRSRRGVRRGVRRGPRRRVPEDESLDRGRAPGVRGRALAVRMRSVAKRRRPERRFASPVFSRTSRRSFAKTPISSPRTTSGSSISPEEPRRPGPPSF